MFWCGRESYAGLYIPMLSDRILNNTAEAKVNPIHLQGSHHFCCCQPWITLYRLLGMSWFTC